ncbi:tRNA adenosine(34) deaminase TadA [Geminocystis sp. NIES-3709]|uniref:tRNA adenosine(34) deaminase TadA n=1 Tax=Geminocystis sp. NIES-3709 TaxID=1617448 RepID=UPI0005FC46BF|nr:tRNA adenosine(34) deaminase TadA [Geminocystis sp. NIES-3709]BAQ64501.1 tRNA-specific adenosine-34 deaminase [Geminocystis sp. NIES-3709]
MSDLHNHQYWMKEALTLAIKAGEEGEIPVGAVIIDRQNKLISSSYNQKEKYQDCTAHAEILAIRDACKKLSTWRLHECTLYVTLEPCPMCAGAIIQARLKTLIYGVDDFKTGAIRTVLNIPDSDASNHHLQVFGGIKETACRSLLTSWFESRR